MHDECQLDAIRTLTTIFIISMGATYLLPSIVGPQIANRLLLVRR
jgi:hypothetical protein